MQPSTLPYQLPPFDKIQDSDFAPAFEAGMAKQLAEIQEIVHNPAPPSFDNTIVAMEKSGRLLGRVKRVFFSLLPSNSNPALEKIEADISPKLSIHSDTIFLDPALFARVDALYQKRDSLALDPESLQLLERYQDRFVRAGARLPQADRAKLQQLNEELSSLQTQFRQRVLQATKAGAVVVDDVEQLNGLTPVEIGAAAQAAKARGLDGKWLITLQNTTIQPPLTELENRALRHKIFEASSMRNQGGSYDTTAIITKIVRLRADKARLLGYDSFAAYALADETASTPKAVNDLLAQIAPAALAKAKTEAAQIQRQINKGQKAAKQKRFALEPWDWAYYAGQVRKAEYSYHESDVKPYFELDHVLKDGVFYAAHELYGLTFTVRKDLPVYNPDVRVFEVHDADGSALGLVLLDYYKRDNKQGGAWMDSYVKQNALLDQKPVIVNNLNIPKPPAGQPTLLTFDEVTTMFHEFGHGLHGLLSHCRYPTLSGTSVPRDFVEFPSQLNEMWASDPKVLANYAKHYQTGKPMPKKLFDKVLASQTYGQGYATLEYLEAALLDQSWHQAPAAKLPTPDQVMTFEAAALLRDHVSYAPVPPRYHSPYFSHTFSGGYAASYYAYIWSEVLARDAGAWFHQHGGLSRAAGAIFRDKILSRGRTEEPKVLFEQFYGKPDIKPLLEYRGLKTR